MGGFSLIMSVKRKKVKRRIKYAELLFIAAAVMVIIAVITSVSINSEDNINDTQKNFSSAITKSTKSNRQETQVSTYSKLMKIQLKLKFGNKIEVINQDLLSEWVNENKSGNKNDVDVNEELLREYVTKLGKKYSTYTDYITFKTTGGETVDLRNNSMGWILDEDYAFTELKSMIEEMKSISLDLTDRSEESDRWWMRIASDFKPDKGCGDTYAEVSIADQHMWVYKNGKIVLESDVVTGDPTDGHDTPTGAFVIGYKQKDANLYDTDYLIRVKYWISFNNDVGFHDAEWQDSFGGYVYTYSGSHGCVNMPLDAVSKLYDITYENMPVFVY